MLSERISNDVNDLSQSQGGRETQSQATPPPPAKRKRTSKATSSQFEELLVKLEAQPHLASRQFRGLQGRQNFELGWKELSQYLNQLPNGAVKTPEQWMTVWRDFKSRCCIKAAKLNKERAQTGNRGVNTPPLTELERRVISLIGIEYTIGTSCPDAMPEEDAVQRDLEAGVAVDPFIDLSLNINDGILTEAESHINSEQSTSQQALELPTSNRSPRESQQALEITTSDNPSNPRESRHQYQSQQALEITTDDRNPRDSRQQNQQPRRNRGLNPRRSVAEQHDSARSDFLAVAQSNADAMKVLAAATKMQAEASKMHAEAAKTQADALMLFAEAANKICQIIKDNLEK